MKSKTPHHSAEGAALTRVILETFRLNGRLLTAGDALVGDLGVTSARWQVLGAVDPDPMTVAHVARLRGLRRQSVQRIVDALADEGLVELRPNPDHRRARLVALSREGRRVLDEVSRRQVEWANTLATGLSAHKLDAALSLMQRLRDRLEREGG